MQAAISLERRAAKLWKARLVYARCTDISQILLRKGFLLDSGCKALEFSNREMSKNLFCKILPESQDTE